MKKKTPEEIVVDIQKACQELGLHIGLKDQDNLSGLIIGKIEFIQEVLAQLDDADDYEIWGHPTSSESNGNLH